MRAAGQDKHERERGTRNETRSGMRGGEKLRWLGKIGPESEIHTTEEGERTEQGVTVKERWQTRRENEIFQKIKLK